MKEIYFARIVGKTFVAGIFFDELMIITKSAPILKKYTGKNLFICLNNLIDKEKLEYMQILSKENGEFLSPR